MHEFEVVWGQSDVVFDFCTYTEQADDITLANAISGGPGGEGGENGGIIISGNTVKHICDGWNHGKFPMSLLRYACSVAAIPKQKAILSCSL